MLFSSDNSRYSDAVIRRRPTSAAKPRIFLVSWLPTMTDCLDLTVACTTGWVNCANEPSQDAYGVIRLTHSKAAVWTVEDVARLIKFKKRILICLLILQSVAYDPKERQKLDLSQNSALLYLFIIRIFKTFHPSGCTAGCNYIYTLQLVVRPVVQPVVQLAAKCTRTF